jgi:hypothetical protein
MYITLGAIAFLLVMAFNFTTNLMNANAIDFGLISKDINVGSIDTDNLFNCFGAAITCDNDNTINNSNNADNDTNTPSEQRGTLLVAKIVACKEDQRGRCDLIKESQNFPTSSDYEITVAGNNPSISSFPGSVAGTQVTLGVGHYAITEEQANLDALRAEFNFLIYTTTDATGDCNPQTDSSNNFVRATGTMTSGNSQECVITNTINVETLQ